MTYPDHERSRPARDGFDRTSSGPDGISVGTSVPHSCGCLARARAEHEAVQHMIMNPRGARCRPVYALVDGFRKALRMDERCGRWMSAADGAHYVGCPTIARTAWSELRLVAAW